MFRSWRDSADVYDIDKGNPGPISVFAFSDRCKGLPRTLSRTRFSAVGVPVADAEQAGQFSAISESHGPSAKGFQLLHGPVPRPGVVKAFSIRLWTWPDLTVSAAKRCTGTRG